MGIRIHRICGNLSVYDAFHRVPGLGIWFSALLYRLRGIHGFFGLFCRAQQGGKEENYIAGIRECGYLYRFALLDLL